MAHHVPDWIAHWVAPDLPTIESARELLTTLHTDLLLEADRGPGVETYVAAAVQVGRLLERISNMSFPSAQSRRGWGWMACATSVTADRVRVSIERFIAALITVLRDWDDTTTHYDLTRRFSLVEAWKTNVALVAADDFSATYDTYDIPSWGS